MTRGLSCWLLAGALAIAAPAAADEPEEGGRPNAIQNRKHTMGHEFTLGVGTIPVDAYYKGLTGTFQYTLHLSDSWAWEVVSFSYCKDFWTSLREDLENNWKQPGSPKIPEMAYFGDTNLVWKPFYGKLAYLNRSLVYGELFWVIGAAGAKYSTPGTSGVYVGGDTGFGFRVHLSEHFSTRFDFRYYRFQRLNKAADNDNVLFVQLGLSLNFR
jgi:outer membrane beta-barrel protein